MPFSSVDNMERGWLSALRRTSVVILPVFLLVIGIITAVLWSEIRNHHRVTQQNEQTRVMVGKQAILNTIHPIVDDLHFLSRMVASNTVLVADAASRNSLKAALEADIVNLAASHGYYDQIRVIDATGKERVRVSNNDGHPEAVMDADLQMSAQRSYFKDTMRLSPGQIYISALDLDIVPGRTETPPKPMIHLATPIAGRGSEHVGLVMLNCNAQVLLDNFSGSNQPNGSTLMLIDSDGNWLKGTSGNDEFGDAYPDGRERTLAERFPEVWQAILSMPKGYMKTRQGMFTFATLDPLGNCPDGVGCTGEMAAVGAHDRRWIIVSHHRHENIAMLEGSLIVKASLTSLVAILVLLLVSFRMVTTDIQHRRADYELRCSKEDLETAVTWRTSELEQSNAALRSQIDERKRIEQALRQSERQFRTLVETMHEGIFIVDTEDRLTFVNEQFSAMLGYRPVDILGRAYTEFLTPENGSRLKQALGHGADECRTPCELAWVRQNGEAVLTHFSPSTLYTDDGTHNGSFAVVTDITDQKRSQAERQELEHRLRQAQKMEAIGVLAGGIAHDFNNILMPIMGYTELINASLPEDDKIRMYVRPIMEASQRAKELVFQILSFSRQTSDELKPTMIAPLVSEPLKLLKASIPSNIAIDKRITAKDAVVMANPVQIHQVVMNLCTNAYHAMEKTGGEITVSLETMDFSPTDGKGAGAEAAPYVRLSIADTGPGIAPEFLPRIFEPYFTTKSKGKGTGLGLSMVHGIVTACGGEIRVDSRPGEGTTFQVYLPMIVPADDGMEKNLSAELVGGTERILLVDDEAPIVQLEKRLLERLGYTVMTKMNSLDALEAFRGDPDAFDLVITDLTMPNLTGLALAEKLVTLRPDIPVIMLTGFSEHLKGKKIRAAGIRRIILKPALTKDLSEAIRQVLDGDDTVETDSDVLDSMAEARYSMA